jgi:hypothetical protein
MAGTPTRDEFSRRWMKLLEELKKVNTSPRATVMLFSCYMEWIVNSLLERVCKEGKRLSEADYIPLKAKVLLLYELGIVTGNLYHDLGLLLDERNKAVHRVKYQFDYSIRNKLVYPKTATRPDVEQLKNSPVPWVCISLYLLNEATNIAFEKYFR